MEMIDAINKDIKIENSRIDKLVNKFREKLEKQNLPILYHKLSKLKEKCNHNFIFEGIYHNDSVYRCSICKKSKFD